MHHSLPPYLHFWSSSGNGSDGICPDGPNHVFEFDSLNAGHLLCLLYLQLILLPNKLGLSLTSSRQSLQLGFLKNREITSDSIISEEDIGMKVCVQKIYYIYKKVPHMTTPSFFFTHGLNFGGLRLQLGLFDGCFSLNLGSLCARLCLRLCLSSRLHRSAVGLEFEELLAGSLCLSLIRDLLTLQSTFCLLFQTFSFVSGRKRREL